MHDPLVMSRGQAGTQTACDLNRFGARQLTDAAQQRSEILAVDVLHRDEGGVRCGADVVNTADVRV